MNKQPIRKFEFHEISGIGALSRALAQSPLMSWALGTTNHDSTSIAVDLQRCSGLEISDYSVLALVAKALAERGHSILIHARGSTAAELRRLRFASLFRRKGFRNRVTVKLTHTGSIIRDPVIPFTWITAGSFAYNRDRDIWFERPKLRKPVRDLIAAFLDSLPDQIAPDLPQLLTQVFVLELGWNIVLHSNNSQTGSGVLAGRVIDRAGARSIELSLVDLGRGIPAALKAQYEGNYHRNDPRLFESGIIRYAFDREGTSRPPLSVPDGPPGLQLVADGLRGIGDIAIRSNGGLVRYEGRHIGIEPTLHPQYHDAPVRGTSVAVRFDHAKPLGRRAFQSGGSEIKLPFAILQISSLRGDQLPTRKEEARTLLETRIDPTRPLLIDFEYRDQSVHVVQAMCQAAFDYTQDGEIVLWNVATPPSQLTYLATQWWSNAAVPQKRLPPLVVRAFDDAMFLGEWPGLSSRDASLIDALVSGGGRLSDVNPAEEGVYRIALGLETYLRIARTVNSEYLRRGFDRPRNDLGFFTGDITLMSGANVGEYFSVGRNCSSDVIRTLRWAEPVRAAVTQLTAHLGGQRVTIIAFAASVRDVARTVIKNAADASLRGFTVLSYDVPSPDELSEWISVDDTVILLTDVRSTGTLLSSIQHLVGQIGARVAGAIAVVDTKAGYLTPSDAAAVEYAGVPFIAVAGFSPAAPAAGAPKFWVDPISFVPRLRSEWHSELDPRIRETISASLNAESAAIGHRVEGTRHASLTINVGRFLDHNSDQVSSKLYALRSSIDRDPQWSGFAPSVVLFPAGSARVEPLRQADEEPAIYGSAVDRLTELVRESWTHADPSTFPPAPSVMPIVRTFDPSGASRCASTLDIASVDDVIIVDDGIWSGRTAKEMLRLAIDHGAGRVLVLVLIGRGSRQEMEYWESLTEIATGSRRVTIRTHILYLLPTPYYNKDTCPYCSTMRSLQHWKLADPNIGALADEASEELRPLAGTARNWQSKSFVRTWVRLRVYAELAGDNEVAFGDFRHAVERVAERGASDELRALFTLFLEEWRLLSQPRIRQTLAEKIRQLAINAIGRSDLPLNTRVAALSLVRSGFPESFSGILDKIQIDHLTDVTALSRFALHVSTHCRRRGVDDGINRAINRALDTNAASKGTAAAQPLRTMLQSRDRSRRAVIPARDEMAAAIELDKHYSRSTELLQHERQHHAEVLLMTLAGAAVDGAPHIPYDKALGRLNAHIIPLAKEVILPNVQVLGDHFRAVELDPRVGQADEHLSYVLTMSSPGSAFRNDLATVEFSLEMLARNPSAGGHVNTMAEAAARLLNYVYSRSSRIARLVSSLHALTAAQAADLVRATLEDSLREYGLVLSAPILMGSQPEHEATVFAPARVIKSCAIDIALNLATHAFPTGRRRDPRVELRLTFEQTTPSNRRDIVISVLNNGAPMTTSRDMQRRAHKAPVRLARAVNGDLRAPTTSRTAEWTVEQAMVFKRWDGA